VSGPAASALPRGLVRFSAGAAPRRRLYCFPYAGGGPATFRQWPPSLPAGTEVIAVQLPGRNPASGEVPVDSIERIVAIVTEAIVELQEREPLPFSVFGHSMGALVAYEVVVALECAGAHLPDRLFVSGRRPPDELHEGDPMYDLPDEDFLDAMQRSYGGVPALVRNEPDLLALFLPSLRADIRALETYRPSTSGIVACPVRVFGGADDRHPRPSQLAGWQRVAARDISIRVFDGDHFFLVGAREALTADIGTHG
jgi:surfactin synthase thioesterase subunit